MAVLERLIQKVRPDKWEELEVFDKKFDVIEGAAGFPSKKRYVCLAGGLPQGTLIIEREWESLAAAEAAYAKFNAEPAALQLGKEFQASGCIEGTQVRELYQPLP